MPFCTSNSRGILDICVHPWARAISLSQLDKSVMYPSDKLFSSGHNMTVNTPIVGNYKCFEIYFLFISFSDVFDNIKKWTNARRFDWVQSGNGVGLRDNLMRFELVLNCIARVANRFWQLPGVSGVRIHWYWIFMRTFRAVQLQCLIFSVAQLYWEYFHCLKRLNCSGKLTTWLNRLGWNLSNACEILL